MADFTSSSNTYSLSKGPKSLYYGQGDQDLFGVILNVPQTDDDDEWGGTGRIAFERIIDRISDLILEVEDPYGSGTSGLLNQMNALTGAGGLINLTTPSMALGNILLNGSTNEITIGSSSKLSSSLLTVGTDFKISAISNGYSAAYKNTSVRWFDNGSSPTITLNVDGSTLILSKTALTLSSGVAFDIGEISVSGDISVDSVTCSSISCSGIIQGTGFLIDSYTKFKDSPSVPGAPASDEMYLWYRLSDKRLHIWSVSGDTFLLTPTVPNLFPEDGTTNIGTSSNRFDRIYAKEVDTQALVFGGSLTVTNMALTGTLSVGGISTFNGLVNAPKGLTCSTSFTTTGAATINTTLNVQGVSHFGSNVTLGDAVFGDADLDVIGDITAKSGTFSGALSAGSLSLSSLSLTGSLSVGTTLSVTGTTTLGTLNASTASFSGTVNINGSLNSTSSTILVNEDFTISSGYYLYGSIRSSNIRPSSLTPGKVGEVGTSTLGSYFSDMVSETYTFKATTSIPSAHANSDFVKLFYYASSDTIATTRKLPADITTKYVNDRTDYIPAVDGGINLGSTAIAFGNIYSFTVTTNFVRLSPFFVPGSPRPGNGTPAYFWHIPTGDQDKRVRVSFGTSVTTDPSYYVNLTAIP